MDGLSIAYFLPFFSRAEKKRGMGAVAATILECRYNYALIKWTNNNNAGLGRLKGRDRGTGVITLPLSLFLGGLHLAKIQGIIRQANSKREIFFQTIVLSVSLHQESLGTAVMV